MRPTHPPRARTPILALGLIALSLALAQLACNFPGLGLTEAEAQDLQAQIARQTFLQGETPSSDGGQVTLILTWPIEMDPTTFTQSLLEAMVLAAQAAPRAESIQAHVWQLGQSFVAVELAASDLLALQAGELDAETLLGAMAVDDTRPAATRVRHALEDRGYFVVEAEADADSIELELYVDQAYASDAALIAQWLEVFELLAAEDEWLQDWTVRFALPDYSRTIVSTTREDYLAFQSGELEPAAFLARLEVAREP